MEIKDLINEIMDNHVGEENAIPWMTLHQMIQNLLNQAGDGYIDPGELRNIIKGMRRNGILIASSPRGYFRPSSLAEHLKFVNRVFRPPAKDMLLTARIQRQAAVNFFGGQYALFDDLKTSISQS